MMKNSSEISIRDILVDGLERMGIESCPMAIEKFHEYYRLILDKNRVMNLTAIEGAEETARLHFLDCAALLNYADFEGKKTIDIGSGAGFPGIPMKIIQPNMELTLLDSQGKRIDFLRETCKKIELSGVECIKNRAEEAPSFMRQAFDVAVSRAVARLRVLAELCLPFVKPGGAFLAMKGPEPFGELHEAEGALNILGAKEDGVFFYTIPETDIKHSIIRIKKTENTPALYPRRFAKIQKSPL